MKKLLFSLLLLPLFVKSQYREYRSQVIPLYTDSIPNSTGYYPSELVEGDTANPVTYQKVSRPTITAYLPAKMDNHAAVIIFPGGAYTFIAFKDEGTNIAQHFANHGIAAFVVKYRLPDDLTMEERSIGPLQDAQQAIKIVRMRASEWGLDTGKIGVMGFSAGGHLAATVATHFEQDYIPNQEHTNLRPDFQILLYPVISMADSLTHVGTHNKLLGPYPTADQVRIFSNELQVTNQTPPCWLTHAEDDRIVDQENSISFYKALKQHHVPAEMHLYSKGDHGFVLRQPMEEWMAPLLSWMNINGWIKD